MEYEGWMTILIWILASSLLPAAGLMTLAPEAPKAPQAHEAHGAHEAQEAVEAPEFPEAPEMPSLPTIPRRRPQECLTGTMADVQYWVDEEGGLTNARDDSEALDMSAIPRPSVAVVEQMIVQNNQQTGRRSRPIRYLSLARCGLNRIPPFFDTFLDGQGRNLSQTVEFLSLFGNDFVDVSEPGHQYDVTLTAVGAREVQRASSIHRGQARSMWSAGLQRVQFQYLRELDLRASRITTLDMNVFQTMPNLEALYLGNNNIHTIRENAFLGLTKLKHIDLSSNVATNGNGRPIMLELNRNVFDGLDNLKSLDLSNTLTTFRRVGSFRSLGGNIERLSLCHVGASNFPRNFFQDVQLRFLDLSGNHGVFQQARSLLDSMKDTLQVLYASEVGLTTFEIFKDFKQLQVLKLNNNEISRVREDTASTLRSLVALDLRRNRITNWFTDVYSLMPWLTFLDIRNNMLTVISNEMLYDLANVSFLALSGNSFVCNCHSKDFIQLAAKNELDAHVPTIEPPAHLMNTDEYSRFAFHSGFRDMNNIVSHRKNISRICKNRNCNETEFTASSKFLLVDYDDDAYTCLMVAEGSSIQFQDIPNCRESYNVASDVSYLENGRKYLYALFSIPGLFLILLVYFFRRNLRYFYVTVRNSAMLSMVNKNKIINDDTLYNYDVFVSYCNEDRPWVLDQLLSHLETDCSVSLCLHERDFQVGLSILENIVSCMDRSKAIMLVISQQFLRSQWCQFEMHLAQHRLLETRREDLILILLEDIPRRLRPNTLHYLMLTKTYIVWPKNKAEQTIFWKRLKKSVTTQQNKPDGGNSVV